MILFNRPRLDLPCLWNAPPCPTEMDFALQDVDAEMLRSFDEGYLQPVVEEEFPGRFPVKGRLVGPHHRPLVTLLCKKDPMVVNALQHTTDPVVKIIFVICSNSRYSFLSAEAFDALEISNVNVNSHLGRRVFIDKAISDMFLSRPNSRFAHANILGADFFSICKADLVCDYSEGTFEINKTK